MKIIITTIISLIIMTSLNAQKSLDIEDVKGLNIGDVAPVFTAKDAGSNDFSLNEALKEGPVVIIFYRGFWCPYCNKHLSQIQDSLQLIQDMGARVVAISPEKPEYLEKMADKSGAKFTLLYDDGYKIADAYDVNFKPDSMQLFAYNTILGGKLKETHSDDSQLLPIPATYIVSKEGKIVWRQLDPNYKNRSTVKEIIENLSGLN
jgi:peroxiredoxin